VFLIVGWGLPHQNILEYKQVFGGASPTLHHESLLVMDYRILTFLYTKDLFIKILASANIKESFLICINIQ